MPERELKLLVAEGDLAKARLALLAMAGRPRPSRSKLTTTYYDTPGDALHARELMLRVRKEGRRFVQTVKSRDVSGEDVLERGEWEDRVRGAAPDLDAPHSGGHVRAAVAPGALMPLFTTVVERTAFMLAPAPGHARSRSRSISARSRFRAAPASAIHEVELEFKRGDRVVLWDVALRLREIVPCRIGTRSKGERGYALVARRAGRSRRCCRAHRGARSHDGARRRASERPGGASSPSSCATRARRTRASPRACIRCASRSGACARCCRRCAACCREEHYRWANGELKWIGGALGPARNWDVFAENLVGPVEGALADAPELERSPRAAERHRAQAYDERARPDRLGSAIRERSCGWRAGSRRAAGAISR